MKKRLFRIYDIEEEKYIFKDISLLGEAVLFGGIDQYLRDKAVENQMSYLDALNELEVEEFMGLWDENKDFIYEGDIVEFDDSDIGGEKIIGEVVWNNDTSLNYGWALDTGNGIACISWLGIIKIVGNKHK